jgi:hypothetical protein
MEVCDPLTNVNDLRLMVRSQYALPKKVATRMNRGQICDAFQKCSGNDLPEPPMRYQKVNPTTGVYYPRDTPLSGRDFYSLFSNPKLKELQRIARKLGVFQKDATKSMLFMSITEFLKASGVPEPIQVRLSPNKVVRNNNANNNLRNTNANATRRNTNANNNLRNTNTTRRNTNANNNLRNTNANNNLRNTNATRRNTNANATRRNTNATRRNTNRRPIPTRVGPPVGGPGPRRTMYMPPPQRRIPLPPNATPRLRDYEELMRNVRYGNESSIRSWARSKGLVGNSRSKEELVNQLRRQQREKLNVEDLRTLAKSLGMTNVSAYKTKNGLERAIYEFKKKAPTMNSRPTRGPPVRRPPLPPPPPKGPSNNNNNKKGPPPPQIVEVTKAINNKNVNQLKRLENSTNSNVAKAAKEARVAVETKNNTKLRRVAEETNKTALRNLRMYATRKGVKNASKYETVETLERAIRNAEARAPLTKIDKEAAELNARLLGAKKAEANAAKREKNAAAAANKLEKEKAELATKLEEKKAEANAARRAKNAAAAAKLDKQKAELNAKLEAKKAEANALRRAKNAELAAKIEREKAELNAKLAQAKATKNAELAAKLERQKAELERRKNSGFTYDLPNIQVPKFQRAPPEVRAARREKVRSLFKSEVQKIFDEVYPGKEAGNKREANKFVAAIKKNGKNASSVNKIYAEIYGNKAQLEAEGRKNVNSIMAKRAEFKRKLLGAVATVAKEAGVPQAEVTQAIVSEPTPEAPKNDSVNRIFKRVYPTNADRGNANLAKEFLNKIRKARPNTPNKVEAVFTNVYGNRNELTNKNIINKRNRFARELLGLKKEVNAISPELVKGYKRAFDRDPDSDIIKAIKESDRMPDTIKQIFNKFEGNSNTLSNKERNSNKENRLRERFIKEIKQPESTFKFDNIQYSSNKRSSIENQVQALIAEKHGVKPINIKIEDIKSGSITVIYYIVGIPYNPNRKSLNSVKNINRIEYLTNGTSIIAEANKYKNRPDIANYIKKAKNAKNASEKIIALKQLNKLLGGTKTSKVRERLKTVSKEYNNLIKRFSNKVENAEKLKMSVNKYRNAIASRDPKEITKQNAKIDSDIRTYLQKIAKEVVVTQRTTYNNNGKEVLKTNMRPGGKLNKLNVSLLEKYKSIQEIEEYLKSFEKKQPVPQEKINSLLNKQKYIAQADEIIKQLQLKPPGIKNARRAINNAKTPEEAKNKFEELQNLYKKSIMAELGLKGGNYSLDRVVAQAKKVKPTNKLIVILENAKMFGNGQGDRTSIDKAQQEIKQKLEAYKTLLEKLRLGNSNNWNTTMAAAKKQSNNKEIKKLLGELNITRTPENQKEINEFFANYSKVKGNRSFANLLNKTNKSRFLTSKNRDRAATLLNESQAKTSRVANMLEKVKIMTSLPDVSVFYPEKARLKKFGNAYTETMKNYMDIPKKNRESGFTNKEVNIITRTHGYLSPIIKYLEKHKELYDKIKENPEVKSALSDFTSQYENARIGKLGIKTLGNAHKNANKRFNVARTISAALEFIRENNLQQSRNDPNRTKKYNTLMQKYNKGPITLKELNSLFGAMSALYNIVLTTKGSQENDGKKEFRRIGTFNNLSKLSPVEGVVPAKAKAYQANNKQANIEQARTGQQNATDRLRRFASKPVVVEQPRKNNKSIGVITNTNNKIRERMARINRTFGKNNSLELLPTNATALKEQVSSNNFNTKLEIAQKRRELAHKRLKQDAGRPSLPLNMDQIIKAEPKLRGYEENLKTLYLSKFREPLPPVKRAQAAGAQRAQPTTNLSLPPKVINEILKYKSQGSLKGILNREDDKEYVNKLTSTTITREKIPEIRQILLGTKARLEKNPSKTDDVSKIEASLKIIPKITELNPTQVR